MFSRALFNIGKKLNLIFKDKNYSLLPWITGLGLYPSTYNWPFDDKRRKMNIDIVPKPMFDTVTALDGRPIDFKVFQSSLGKFIDYYLCLFYANFSCS